MFRKPVISAQMFGIPKPTNDSKLIMPGDQNHGHKFINAPWDPSLGLSVTNLDDEKNPFQRATYRDLFVCECGAKKLRETRALV